MTVAALFVETNGVYSQLDDVDLWDVERDARRYAGPHPVVAHPPCKTWSQMSNCRPEIVRGDDDGAFAAALEAVRTYGGVLEHPANSYAWSRYELPRPTSHGWASSLFDIGWTCEVDQAHYGHRANKRAWLYFVGDSKPDVIHGRAPATGVRVHDDGGGGRDQRSRTPRAFAEALIALARSSRANTQKGDAMAENEIVRLLSVTSIISRGLGKEEPLLTWAAKQTAIAAVESRATLEAMLKEQGADAAQRWLVDARWRTLERAQARGTQLHRAAEQHALGTTPLLAPEVQPYFEQYERWLKTWKPKTLMAEATVYNPAMRYAGTLDGIVELGGRVVLYDIKTTPKGPDAKSRHPYPEVALQLAAYARATHVGIVPPTREETRSQRTYDFDPSAAYESMPKVDAALCVVVSPHDCYAKTVDIGEATWAAFRYVNEIARWRRAYCDTGALFGAAMIADPSLAVA